MFSNIIHKAEGLIKEEVEEVGEKVEKVTHIFEKHPSTTNGPDDADYVDKAAASAPALSSSAEVEGGLPKFEGKLFDQSNPDYEKRAYQYAYTSVAPNTMKPKFILYPSGDSDVMAAINYAKAQNVAIAVRTGGHQYGGCSSTNGENIQLDMSQTYCEFEVNSDRTEVKTGISHALLAFNENMAKHGLFMPTGQCRHVHVGGHVQTGGYGQLARAFGLFGDCVQKVRIITDSDQGATVRVISRDATTKSEQDLFFAVLGGSPGNFGVLTHLWIRPFRDEDYPDCRGLKAMYRWDKDKMRKILDVMVDMQCDPDFPRNFDLCVSVLTNTFLILPYMFAGLDMDAEMRKTDPEWGKDGMAAWPNVIVLYAQYVNIPGQEPKPDADAWFNKIMEAAGTPLLGDCVGMRLNPSERNVMSKIIPNWLFLNYREYLLPFVKRCHVTNWTQQLRDNKWSEWMSERIDQIEKKWVPSKFLAVQIQPFGGKNSMYHRNGLDGKTAYSWRGDTTIVAVCDLFYKNTGLNKTTKDEAEAWQAESDKEAVGELANSRFCDLDRRMLWGSYGTHILTQDYPLYYEPEKYEKLLKIKTEVDPKQVFSPNSFCVGGAHPESVRATAMIQANDGADVVAHSVDEAEMVKSVLAITEEHYKNSNQTEHVQTIQNNIKGIHSDAQRMADEEKLNTATNV